MPSRAASVGGRGPVWIGAAAQCWVGQPRSAGSGQPRSAVGSPWRLPSGAANLFRSPCVCQVTRMRDAPAGGRANGEPTSDDGRDGYVTFVECHQHRLLRAAYLICGNQHQAEDLLQDALLKLALRWPSVRDGDPAAYVRAILYRDAVSWWRRRRREWLSADPPERPTAVGTGHCGSRCATRSASCRPGSGAVLVLRYFEDLTEVGHRRGARRHGRHREEPVPCGAAPAPRGSAGAWPRRGTARQRPVTGDGGEPVREEELRRLLTVASRTSRPATPRQPAGSGPAGCAAPAGPPVPPPRGCPARGGTVAGPAPPPTRRHRQPPRHRTVDPGPAPACPCADVPADLAYPGRPWPGSATRSARRSRPAGPQGAGAVPAADRGDRRRGRPDPGARRRRPGPRPRRGHFRPRPATPGGNEAARPEERESLAGRPVGRVRRRPKS